MSDTTDFERLQQAASELLSGDLRALDTAEVSDGLVRLGETLSELAEGMERRARQNRLLTEITRRINLGLMPDQVLSHVFDSFRPVIPYDRIGFALVDEDRDVVRAGWHRADYEPVELRPPYSAPVAGSSLQRILETGAPRIINDLPAYLREHPASASTRLAVREGIRSSLTCPLVVEGRPVGFLFFSSRAAYTYSELHIELFERIARQLSVIVEKSQLYQQIADEQAKSERLLLNILPADVARELRDDPGAKVARRYDAITVVFADIVGFTSLTSSVAPEDLIDSLGRLFADFDDVTAGQGVEKIKTIGDAYMAAAGLPTPTRDHADRALAVARDMMRAAQRHRLPDGSPVVLRIGLHTGPAAAGVVGRRRFSYDIWGDTVNTASRMESTCEPGFIQISEATRGALSDRSGMRSRGQVDVKGKGSMETWLVDW